MFHEEKDRMPSAGAKCYFKCIIFTREQVSSSVEELYIPALYNATKIVHNNASSEENKLKVRAAIFSITFSITFL